MGPRQFLIWSVGPKKFLNGVWGQRDFKWGPDSFSNGLWGQRDFKWGPDSVSNDSFFLHPMFFFLHFTM